MAADKGRELANKLLGKIRTWNQEDVDDLLAGKVSSNTTEWAKTRFARVFLPATPNPLENRTDSYANGPCLVRFLIGWLFVVKCDVVVK